MSKAPILKDSEHLPQEAKFDQRLLDKKVEHKFMTRQERDAFLKSIPEETEYDFTSMEEVMKLDQ